MFVKNAFGEKMRTYALLDSGSNRHVVSERVCAALGIEGIETPMCVTTLESTFEGPRRIADVEVEGVNGVELTLNNAIFGNIIAGEDDVPPSDADVEGMAPGPDKIFGCLQPRVNLWFAAYKMYIKKL